MRESRWGDRNEEDRARKVVTSVSPIWGEKAAFYHQRTRKKKGGATRNQEGLLGEKQREKKGQTETGEGFHRWERRG